MIYVYVVTDLTMNGAKFYFLNVNNIDEVFPGARWQAYSKINSQYIINGQFVNPDQLEELEKENKVYETVYVSDDYPVLGGGLSGYLQRLENQIKV